MSADKWTDFEERRQVLQRELDAQKTPMERNKMGQFSTPCMLAKEIVKCAGSLLGAREKISFLDPAVGTGVFYSALRSTFPGKRIRTALGFEVDPHYGIPSSDLWREHGLSLQLADFTKSRPEGGYNLLVCNPPYVRHHHLPPGMKPLLAEASFRSAGIRLSGLAGLYCHFVALSHPWLSEGGVAAWLIPSEFMDVNYGQALKEYLLRRVTLLSIHRFDPNSVQFSDALVSSAVVVFRKSAPPEGHQVEFSYGGTLAKPAITRKYTVEDLSAETKWTRFPGQGIRRKSGRAVLSDLFKIKRGLATGNNKFFILSSSKINELGLPMEVFKPVIPSSRHVPSDEVLSDSKGWPKLSERQFLLDTKMSEEEIRERFPALASYLKRGNESGVSSSYLSSRRRPWYSQENRPAAPIYCTYLGRGDKKSGRPFRFIRNRSEAVATNVYLALYPTEQISSIPGGIDKVWQYLNTISAEDLLGEGRVYGGGLYKLEPKELANVPIDLDAIWR